jgi:two-component system sensor histidine kinase ChiS
MTIFFSDIRQFTELSENLTPEESFAFINSYLSRIVPEISKNGGFVDKYIGDAILALFPQKNGPDMAVRTAINIQKKIQEYNSHRAKCGYRPLAMGMGIHTGTLMLGVVGTKDRMQNTVISDAVNLASRVESLTKAFRVSLAISEETFKKLEDPGLYKYRFVAKVRVKGKAEPVSIFEIFDGVNPSLLKRKIEANRYFEQGMMDYYQKHYAEALAGFRKVLDMIPDDGASAFYMDNCLTKIKTV